MQVITYFVTAKKTFLITYKFCRVCTLAQWAKVKYKDALDQTMWNITIKGYAYK